MNGIAIQEHPAGQLCDVADTSVELNSLFPAQEVVESKPPRIVSEARKRAARENGAKSRGPKTEAGKDNSSRNALRHGILARKIAPLNDDRLENREYEHLVKDLTREFSPLTITETNAVATLAFDYVKLSRCQQLSEVTGMVNVTFNSSRRQSPADLEEKVELTDELIGQLRKGWNMNCPTARAEPLAIEIVKWIDDRLEHQASYDEDIAAGNPLTDPEELARWKLCKRIDPETLVTLDRDSIASALTGKTALNAGKRRRWTVLLDEIRVWLRRRLEFSLTDEEAFHGQYRRKQAELIERVPTMEVLQRYETQIRRSIAKTIEFLEARLRARR